MASMRCAKEICVGIAALIFAGSSWLPANAQHKSNDSNFYYVAPHLVLALRTLPTLEDGLRIAAMPNGTILQVLQQRQDRWWYVRVLPSGQEGWVLSGQGDRQWIECCVTMDRVFRNSVTQIGFSAPR
jgi:hypothetical protein